jgi:glycosyltransferase involved in cell wall biosynthesis
VKFLLLNQFYPPDMAPTGQVLHDLARTLAARGHEVTVLCSRRSYDGGKLYPALEKLEGVTVKRLPSFGFGRRRFAAKVADYLSFILCLAATLCFIQPRPDLILCLTTPPYLGILGKAAALLRRCRHAHWVMDLYPDVLASHGMISRGHPAYRLLGRLSRAQWSGSSLVLCLGPRMAEKTRPYLPPAEAQAVLKWMPLWGHPGLKPAVPGGPEQEFRRKRGWENEALVLMYSGNMGLGHRFSEFLQAADRLGPSGPLWAFAGGGKRRKEVEDFAAAHPRARIQVLPYVPAEDLAASLGSADAHLASLDSAWQGLMVPSKIQGIFAVGKPVIFVGKKENELADWISAQQAGWVVEEGDVEGLVEVLGQLADPAERARRGRAAWEFSRRNFDRRSNCAIISGWLERSFLVKP